jgi:hypothetical protein
VFFRVAAESAAGIPGTVEMALLLSTVLPASMLLLLLLLLLGRWWLPVTRLASATYVRNVRVCALLSSIDAMQLVVLVFVIGGQLHCC